jgi:hypothetical protein
MIEAFKLGFMYAAGALSAGVAFLILWGAWDWAAEWVQYVINAARLMQHRGKGGRYEDNVPRHQKEFCPWPLKAGTDEPDRERLCPAPGII